MKKLFLLPLFYLLIGIFIPSIAMSNQVKDTCIVDFSYSVDASNKLKVDFENKSTSSNPIDSVHWNFGDGGFSFKENPSHLYSKEGTYRVILEIESNGKWYETAKNIELKDSVVTPPADTCIVDFNYSVDASNKLKVDFENTSTSSNPIDSTVWRFGDGTNAFKDNPSHVYSKKGTYKVILEIKSNNKWYETGKNIELKDSVVTPPADTCIVDFSYTIDANNKLKVDFENKSTSSNPIDSVHWNFGDGGFSFKENPSHMYSKEGTYKVILEIKSNNKWYETGKYIELKDSVVNTPYSISGTVFKGNLPLGTGNVILFYKNANNWKYSDYTNVSNGVFKFKNIDEGKYKLLAIPDSLTFSEYLPTFYHHTVSWNNANIVDVTGDVSSIDISLVSLYKFYFNGIGKASSGIENLKSGEKSQIKKTMELPYHAILKNANGEFIATKEVKNGKFGFEQLSYGTYSIEVWKTGVCEYYSDAFSITEDQPVVNDIPMKKGNSSLGIPDVNIFSNIKTFPVPCKDYLNMEINSKQNGNCVIKIYDTTGNEKLSTTSNIKTGKNLIELRTSDFNSGLYFIQVSGLKGIKTVPFVKK